MLTKIADGKPYEWLLEEQGKRYLNKGSAHGIHADLSPTGTMLVYSVCDTDKENLHFPNGSEPGSFDLAITSMDGAKPRIITPDLGYQGYPAWSPDGSRIAYIHGDEDNLVTRDSELRVIRVDEQGGVVYPTPTPTPGYYRVYHKDVSSPGLRPPVWSPDSQHIAYIHGRITFQSPGGMRAVSIVDGTGKRRSKHLWFTKTQPTWSPDSSRIAFVYYGVEDGERQYHIHIMSPDGKEHTKIAVDPGIAILSLAWHPDGTEILTGGSNIYSLDLETQELRLLIYTKRSERVLVTGLAWSPDGNKIAFRMGTPWKSTDCTLHVFTAKRNGEEPTLIATTGGSVETPITAINRPATPDVMRNLNVHDKGCFN